MSDQCHVGAGNKVFAFSSAQVGTMMSEMEDEADRVSAQIEAALLDTTFSPSSTWGGVHLPRDNSILVHFDRRSTLMSLCAVIPIQHQSAGSN